MIPSGTLAVTVPMERAEAVSKALGELGTRFAFVGRVTEGVGVHVVRNDESIHYRDIRCEEDDLARMLTLYPRDG